jgi:hypothetical protein
VFVFEDTERKTTQDVEKGDLIAIENSADSSYNFFETENVNEHIRVPELYLSDLQSEKKMKFAGMRRWHYLPTLLASHELSYMK